MRARDAWRRMAVHAARRPDAVALDDLSGRRVTWGELLPAVAAAAARLRASRATCVGLLADNGLDWALADLGALALGVTLVPLPGFFADAQLRHVLACAGVEALLSDDPARAAALVPGFTQRAAGPGCLTLLHADGRAPDGRADARVSPGGPAAARARAARITFTSGTTGAPKGVRLSEATLLAVAGSLAAATEADTGLRHLCALPLSILLEDVGGILRTLLAGGCVLLPPTADVGLRGSSELDPERLLRALDDARAGSAILMPQMLSGLVERLEAGVAPAPPALSFVGVGGAPVPGELQARARAAGLPVFEGYGLSEAASVVALNTRRARRPGSVGRPLPHVLVRIAGDGEIRVGGALFDGYLGDPASEDRTDPARPRGPDPEGLWGTGDLGHLDEDGFLHVHGRRDALLVTGFGRNVEPGWIERELCALPGVARAAVVADGRPGLVAVIVPAVGGPPRPEDLASLNARLPDYARVARWIPADEDFTPRNGELDASGQPCREALRRRYATVLAATGIPTTPSRPDSPDTGAPP